jgi:hypothetical protein
LTLEINSLTQRLNLCRNVDLRLPGGAIEGFLQAAAKGKDAPRSGNAPDRNVGGLPTKTRLHPRLDSWVWRDRVISRD